MIASRAAVLVILHINVLEIMGIINFLILGVRQLRDKLIELRFLHPKIKRNDFSL